MIVLPERIRDAAIHALERLAGRQDIPQDVLIDLQIAAGVLSYSRHLTNNGAPTIREHCREAASLLDTLASDMTQREMSAKILVTLDTVRADAQAIAGTSVEDHELQQRFATFLFTFDHLIMDLLRSAPAVTQAIFATHAAQMMAWQMGLNALSHVPAASLETEKKDTAVRTDDMQRLLRTRLGDSSLTVSNWTPLPGGFGKETCLFKVEGDKVNAELVMRRDVDASLITGVDCHEVRQEYPLVKALYGRGFSVPEPLLIETDSTVVNGPDFMIVRRVAGKVEGDVMGGTGKVAEPIQRELARVTARMHNLPPMPELGEGTRELHPALWGLTTAECVRRYINAWYELYLTKPHMPIPAVHGMFNWLLTHVPESEERPTLVHGDIGLHNLLFHEDRLSTVLDWEFSHIGDPAEDLGILYTVMRQQLDWDLFLDEYCKARGSVPSMQRIRYFEIWMNFRNLCVASIALEQFVSGHLKQIRYGVFATRFIPHYIERVSTLIGEWKD